MKVIYTEYVLIFFFSSRNSSIYQAAFESGKLEYYYLQPKKAYLIQLVAIYKGTNLLTTSSIYTLRKHAYSYI